MAPSTNSYDRPSNLPTTNYRFSPWHPPIPSRAHHHCPRHPCLTATEVLTRRHHKGAHLSSSAELPHKRPSTSPTICYRPSPHDCSSRALHRCPRYPCLTAIEMLRRLHVQLPSPAEIATSSSQPHRPANTNTSISRHQRRLHQILHGIIVLTSISHHQRRL